MENKYYENTKGALPHSIVKKFISMSPTPKKAIDLGCGAGRDTIYLIEHGWNVLAIDRENVERLIFEKLNQEQQKRLKFSKQNFENVKLEDANLIVANFSLPFCNKIYFNEFWNKVINSISKEGYFVGNFFGIKDSWHTEKKQMVFLTENEILDLFRESFSIIELNEIENDGKTAIGTFKHWHIYNIIAKKL